MPVIQITEENKHKHGGKCVVLNSHVHDKQNVQPNQVVTKIGMDYYEAIQAKLVRPFIPGEDDHLEGSVNVIASETKQSVEDDTLEEKIKSKKSKFKNKK